MHYNFTGYYKSASTDVGFFIEKICGVLPHLDFFLQMNWVCDESWRQAFTQTVFFLGSLAGTAAFGYVTDNFSRLTSVVITNIILVNFAYFRRKKAMHILSHF